MGFSLYNGFSNLLLLLPLVKSYTLTTLICCVNSFAFGGQFLTDSTLADIIDYDQFLYGDRVDGMFASTAYFVPKVVGAFASAFPLTLIYTAGFVDPKRGCPGPEDLADIALLAAANVTCAADDVRVQPQSAAVTWTIRLLTGVLPAVASIGAFYFKYKFYVSPDEMDNIRASIDTLAKNPTAPCKDPVSNTMVTWFLTNQLSPADLKLKEQLDVFPHNAIERVHRAGSFSPLLRTAMINTSMTAAFIGASVTLAVITVSQGFLIDQQLNILPTLGCVFIGIGITIAAIAVPRLLVAKALVHKYNGVNAAFPAELVKRYAGRFTKTGLVGETSTAGIAPRITPLGGAAQDL